MTCKYELCRGLKSFNIPSGVTYIGGWAFNLCSELTRIEIPGCVTTIGNRAFQGCKGLTGIEIPSSVTTIGECAFTACSGLESIAVASGNTVYDSRDNCNALIETASNSLILGCQNTVIPASVTGIGNEAFFDCKGLTNIEIPGSVTTLGDYAFADCDELTRLVVPEGVTSIGNEAFRNDRCVIYAGSAMGSPWGATAFYTTLPDEYGFYYVDDEKTQIALYAGTGGDVVIPDGVTSIPDNLFLNNKTIISVSIPASITSIGASAFFCCTGLTNIEIPSSVTSIGNGAFYGCSGLTSIEIPSSVTSIGRSAFYGCTGLSSIEISSSVTSIGRSTFSECTGLSSIEIPSSVTFIDYYAFENCTGLTSVYVNAPEPPQLNGNPFSGIDMSTCTLYVPKDFIERYKSANVWKSFQTIEPNPNADVEKKAVIYMVDGEEYQRDSVAVTADITAIDAPTREGYTFSGWSEIPATMPDNDVTVTGSFTINTHNIIYVVDGTEYQKVENVAFGTTLAAIDAPTREGYTFSGWSEIPATMPDNDVTVTGSFIVNKYAVIYMVDGEEYRRDSVEYGATITLAENPTKESHDFSGWSGYPEDLTMPAGDVIITGGFQFNGLAGVAAPTTSDEYFDLTGKPLAQPQRGINLVRKADGTTRKIIVK